MTNAPAAKRPTVVVPDLSKANGEANSKQPGKRNRRSRLLSFRPANGVQQEKSSETTLVNSPPGGTDLTAQPDGEFEVDDDQMVDVGDGGADLEMDATPAASTTSTAPNPPTPGGAPVPLDTSLIPSAIMRRIAQLLLETWTTEEKITNPEATHESSLLRRFPKTDLGGARPKNFLHKQLKVAAKEKILPEDMVQQISTHLPLATRQEADSKEHRRLHHEEQEKKRKKGEEPPKESDSKKPGSKKRKNASPPPEPAAKKPNTATKYHVRQVEKLETRLDNVSIAITPGSADAAQAEMPSRQIWVPKPMTGSKLLTVEVHEVVTAIVACERALVEKHELQAFSFRNPDIDSSRSRGIVLTFENADLAKRILAMKPALVLRDKVCPFTTYQGGGNCSFSLSSIHGATDEDVINSLVAVYGKKKFTLRRIYAGTYFLSAYWVMFADPPTDYLRMLPIGGLHKDKSGKFTSAQKFAYLDPQKVGKCSFCSLEHLGACKDCKQVLGKELLL